jgi:carbonic anhydrase
MTDRTGAETPAPVSTTRAGRGFDEALARNEAFADAGGHEGVNPVPALGVLVVACLDPRVDPAHLMGLELGDAMVIRNTGGRVTEEVIENIAFVSQLVERMIPDGPLFEVAVIHHTECGARMLADDGFRAAYAARIGVDEGAVRALAVTDPFQTVKIDFDLLRTASAISPRVSFSGSVYDVKTGRLTTVARWSGADTSVVEAL